MGEPFTLYVTQFRVEAEDGDSWTFGRDFDAADKFLNEARERRPDCSYTLLAEVDA